MCRKKFGGGIFLENCTFSHGLIASQSKEKLNIAWVFSSEYPCIEEVGWIVEKKCLEVRYLYQTLLLTFVLSINFLSPHKWENLEHGCFKIPYNPSIPVSLQKYHPGQMRAVLTLPSCLQEKHINSQYSSEVTAKFTRLVTNGGEIWLNNTF